MREKIILIIQIVVIVLITISCTSNESKLNSVYEKTLSIKHDLSYTPFDKRFDDPNFHICDSTKIRSGRNKLQYNGGKKQLREEILTKFDLRQEYKSYNGYIIVRFIINCKGELGRYRTQSLNLDFSPTNSPSDLEQHILSLFKNTENWKKSVVYSEEQEYSKFVNLKFSNGKIQHILF